jgi:hypothetical protein
VHLVGCQLTRGLDAEGCVCDVHETETRILVPAMGPSPDQLYTVYQ